MSVGAPTEECYKMLPARRYRGIWRDEFEGSRFFEGVSETGDVRNKIRLRLDSKDEPRVWLDWRNDQGGISAHRAHSWLVAVDFIGRRTAYPGRYGHMGMSEHEIIADHVLSARPVYTSPEPYIENEFGRGGASAAATSLPTAH